MNNTDPSSWPENAPFNQYGPTPDEEFAKFLDIGLGDIDINFPILDSNLNDPSAEAYTNHDFTALLHDMEMGNFAGEVYGSQQLVPGGDQDDQSLQPFDHQQQYQGSTVGPDGWGTRLAPGNGEQQFSKTQMHGWGPSHSVPPTPNSVELYGNPAELLQRVDPRELVAQEMEMAHQSRGHDLVDGPDALQIIV